MSPRAAWRFISLGFTRVYDYIAGKMDWVAFDLPTEGPNADRPRAGKTARRDVPTCRHTELLGDVRERVEAEGWNVCIVVNDRNTVLGVLRGKSWDHPPDTRVEDAMREGPATVRPSEYLDALVGQMQKRDVNGIVVTKSQGVLIGYLFREDAERALAEAGEERKEPES
jgi:Mg/Co/Ni transporter MgtE